MLRPGRTSARIQGRSLRKTEEKAKTLDPRSGSGMTGEGGGDDGSLLSRLALASWLIYRKEFELRDLEAN